VRTRLIFERLVEYRANGASRAPSSCIRSPGGGCTPGKPGREINNALRRFQSWEQLRIGACDLLDLYDLPAVTRQLSNLADCLIRSCLKTGRGGGACSYGASLSLQTSEPCWPWASWEAAIELQLGHRPAFLPNQDAVLAQKVGERLIIALTVLSDEGSFTGWICACARGARSAPWFNRGRVPGLPGKACFTPWEKQALAQRAVWRAAKPLAGLFCRRPRPCCWGYYEQLRTAVFAMKPSKPRPLRQNGRSWGEVKLGEGCDRDVGIYRCNITLGYGNKHARSWW